MVVGRAPASLLESLKRRTNVYVWLRKSTGVSNNVLTLNETQGVRSPIPAGMQTVIAHGFNEEAPVLIENPLERGTEASPWPFTCPTTGR